MPLYLSTKQLATTDQATAAAQTTEMSEDLMRQKAEAEQAANQPQYTLPSLGALGVGGQSPVMQAIGALPIMGQQAMQTAKDTLTWALPDLAALGVTQPEPTPSGTPAAMPSNAPQTGSVGSSTITQGASGPVLRPGESVGSVTLGDGPQNTQQPSAGGDIDNSSRESFVRTAYPYMLEAAGGDPNLAELMLAKAISENGTIGTGKPFWANNFSGIKGEGDAGSVEADTWEDYGQGRVNIKDKFAAYSTPQKGMAAFMDFLRTNSRYSGALERYQQTGNADALFDDILAAGYATDKQWASKVRSIRDSQVTPVVRQTAGGPRQSLNAGSGMAHQESAALPSPQAAPGSPPVGSGPEQAMWSPDGPVEQGGAFQASAGRGMGQGVMMRGPLNAAPAEVGNESDISTLPAGQSNSLSVSSYNDPDAGGTISTPLPPQNTPANTGINPEIVDGRTAPPTPGGDWQPVQTAPRAGAADPATHLAEDSQSQAPARVAGVTGEFLTPEEERARNASVAGVEPGQRTLTTPPRPYVPTRAPVESLPGEPDYVPRERTGIMDQTEPGGLLEPTGGATRQVTRMARIQRMAAAATGKNPFVAIDDPQWRAANPELAEEYDQLQMEFGIGFVTNTEAPRLASGGRRMAPDAAAVPNTIERARGSTPDVAESAAAARTATPDGEMLLGSGVVPESRRFYHGTASEFGRPDPSTFDPEGLYGPGYYLTDNPTVAGSYAEMTSGSKKTEVAQRIATLESELVDLRRMEREGITGPSWQPPIRAQIERAEQALADVTQAGPNVRAVDVPSNLRLLDADAPVLSSEIDRIVALVPERNLPFIRSVLAEMRRVSPHPITGDELYKQLMGATSPVARPDGSVAARILEEAGYDGITHKGGQRRPLFDADGKPVDHQVTVIYPHALDKIRNAFSGEQGGSGFVPRLSDAQNAAQGGVIGAASEITNDEELTPQERLARIGAGAALGVAAGRSARGRRLPPGTQRQGAGFIPSHANDMRTHVVPPDVADSLDFPVRVPTDPAAVRAIEAIGGHIDPERGVTINVTRAQGPQSAGGVATRGGVFYEAVPEGGRSSFVRGSDDPTQVGGSQVIPATPTRFRSPLVVDDAPGSPRGFDASMQQMDVRVPNRFGEPRNPTAMAIDRAVGDARQAGPEGSPARAEALKEVVRRFGGDESAIEPLLAIRGADASESAWAIRENILAAHARRNGYDGVVTVQRNEPDSMQVFNHPEMKAAQQAADVAEGRLADVGTSVYDKNPQKTPRQQRALDQFWVARENVEATRKRLEAELSDSKITELVDVREARNPTPGDRNPVLFEAEREKNRTLSRVRQIESDLFSQMSPYERRLLQDEGERAVMKRAPDLTERLTELEEARKAAVAADTNLRNLKGSEPPTVTPPGYTLRDDLPRRAGRLPEGFTVEPLDDGSGRWIIENDAGDQFHERTFATAEEARAYGVTHASAPSPNASRFGPQMANSAAPAALGAGAGAEVDEDGNPVGYDPWKGLTGVFIGSIIGRKGMSAAERDAWVKATKAAAARGNKGAAEQIAKVERAAAQQGLPGFEHIDPLTDPVPTRSEGLSILPGNSLNTPREIVDNVIRQEQQQARILARRAAQKPETAMQPGQADLLPESRGLPARIWQTVREAVEPWERRLDIVRYAGVLSDTAAHAINAGGGATMQGVDVLTGPIGAVADAARSRVTGKPREVFFSETPARLKGMRAGWSIGLENAREVLRTGLRPEDAAKQLDRDSAGFASGNKAVDFAFELPLRALAAADAVFRTTAQGGHLAAEGMAAAMKANPGQKITPDMLRNAMKDPALIERADKLAARTVLQEDRAVTRWWRQDVLGKAPPGIKTALSLEFMFTKTPYNIVAQGVGLTPAGLLGVVQDMAQHKPSREIEFRVARAALGTAVMGAAMADYASGNLIGPRPTDEKEASTWPPGQIPWSRKVQVGGQTYYIPLANLGPLAVPPVAAILLNESAKKGGDTQAKAARMALGIGQYAAQNTFLEGVAETGKLFDPRGNVSGNLERHAESIAAQFSPHIVGGGALGREIQQIMGMPARDPDGMIEALLATHPLQDQIAKATGRAPVEPAQDVLGRPRVPNVGGPLRAVARVGQQNDAGVIRAFRSAKEGLPMAAPKQIKDPDTEQMRTLTPKQQHRWRRVFGSALQEEWNGQGNPNDADSLKAIERDAREAANESILGLR